MSFGVGANITVLAPLGVRVSAYAGDADNPTAAVDSANALRPTPILDVTPLTLKEKTSTLLQQF